MKTIGNFFSDPGRYGGFFRQNLPAPYTPSGPQVATAELKESLVRLNEVEPEKRFCMLEVDVVRFVYSVIKPIKQGGIFKKLNDVRGQREKRESALISLAWDLLPADLFPEPPKIDRVISSRSLIRKK